MLLRRSNIFLAFLIALAISLASSHAFAQDDGDTPDPSIEQGQNSQDPGVGRLIPAVPPPASRTIHLNVVVAPAPGLAPVSGLQQIDFVIRDNDVTQNIQSFRAVDSASQAPAEIVIVIDAVNAYYPRIPYERQQVAAFLRDNGGKLAHPTAIAVFTDAGVQMQPAFSTDGNALAAFVEKVTIPIRSIGRSAGFYGASDRFQKSIRGLSTLNTRLVADPGRKLVLWISPGWPFLSGPRATLGKRSQQNIFDSIVSLSTQLRAANITLYSISPAFGGNTEDIFYYRSFLKPIEKPSQVQIGNLSLQVLAAQSGGLVLNSSNDVAGYLKTAASDANVYYELSFDPQPPAQGAGFHSVAVTLTRPGLTARARQCYYSQP